VLTCDTIGRYRRRFPAGNHVSVSHRAMATSGAAA
jgi:hypothetical protein